MVPDARLAKSAATGRATVEEVVVPESFSPYTQQLVKAKTAVIEPNFEGVGDTLMNGIGGGVTFSVPTWQDINEDGAMYECAWCGSAGAHKPDCKALSRNYPRTSLGTQRAMTEALRAEMDRTVESTYYQGSRATARPPRLPKPEPPKDVRTDMQKRFDAIAEELEENK
jgi:hypothetical protein